MSQTKAQLIDNLVQPITGALGSASAPTFSFTSDPNTGLYSPGADQLAISTNGTGRLLVKTVGDTEIVGTPNWNFAGLAVRRTSSNTANSKALSFLLDGDALNSTNLYSNVNFILRTDSAPTTGSTSTGLNTGLEITSPATVRFGTNGSERLRIDSSGRLLVGTSSAGGTELIQIQGTSGGSNLPGGIALRRSSLGNGDDIGYVNFTNASGNIHAGIKAFADGTPGASDYPGALVFSTTADGASSPTERMRIQSSGRKTLFSSDTTHCSSVLSNQGAGTATTLYLGAHTSSGYGTGTISFQVFTNGNVQNTNNSYTGISDIKLKENIVDASSQWDDIKALRPVNYNFKPETGAESYKQLGLIAQEVEQVCPGLVTESPDRDAEGNDLGTVTKSVNYSVLYMKAVKALQEAMERIETLEAKVAALENA